jgi:glutamate 5-kinase
MSAPNKRIVIKFGSGVLTQTDGVALDDTQFQQLTAAVARLVQAGHQCIVVSSGAAAAGMMAFQISDRPTDLATLQACCAVGQTRLMHRYETLFQTYDMKVAQILLTNSDFKTDRSSQNVRNTLDKLLSFDSVVPIINENDTVAVRELKFGDNDELSSRLAVLAEADLLILLTSVDGLSDSDGQLLTSVENVDDVMKFVRDEKGNFSVGGMSTKLQSVKRVVNAGIPAIIANGRSPQQIPDLVAGTGICTRFLTNS